MTRNQIDALKLQEDRRANLEKERIAKLGLPAEYLSSIGALLRGTGSIGSILRGASSPSARGRNNFKNRAESFQWSI